MTEVLFYHLEQGVLENILPDLLEKTLERGWRAVVRASSRERVEVLDGFLWTYRDESFLPHGAGGDGASQPIWLTDGDDVPNQAEVLFLAEGAALDMKSLDSFHRCVVIVNGRDVDALADSRRLWKEAKDSSHDVTYWKQSPQGRWEKQA